MNKKLTKKIDIFSYNKVTNKIQFHRLQLNIVVKQNQFLLQ